MQLKDLVGVVIDLLIRRSTELRNEREAGGGVSSDHDSVCNLHADNDRHWLGPASALSATVRSIAQLGLALQADP